MVLLNAASKVYAGGSLASKVYAGAVQVWPPGPVTSGLSSWYDASDAASFTYSSGVLISQWSDLAGARHLVQATTGAQPSRSGSRNGKPTVVFGGDDVLVFSSTTDTLNVGSLTIILAVGYTSTAANTGIVTVHGTAGNDYDSNAALALEYGDFGDVFKATRNGKIAAVKGSRPMAWSVCSALFRPDGTSAAWRDGAAHTEGTSDGTTWLPAAGGLAVGGRFIGGAVSASYRLVGDIGEVLVYDRVLSDVERMQVEAYLTTKWA